MMKRASVWGWVCLVAAGCAAGPAGAGPAAERGEGLRSEAGERRMAAAEPPSYDTRLSRLPEAPWSEEQLGDGDVPAALIRAWRTADNRRWCAPMAPALVEGVSARTVELDGGWAVAFDVPGKRGVMADGSACPSCGVAAYGVAGTAATAEDWVHLGPADLETSFKDGSLADFESADDGSGAVTATIVASGQDCVYQVWSFLGEDHLRDLVGGLRFVAVDEGGTGRRMAGLPPVAQ